MNSSHVVRRLTRALAAALLVVAYSAAADTRTYMGGGKVALVGIGSATAYGAGHLVKSADAAAVPRWSRPGGLERRLQYLLGGGFHADKTNFLDSDAGSALTPALGLITVGLADLTWPQGDREKTFLQDQFLMWSGLIATKGITDLSKGLFRRTRPVVALEPDLAPRGMSPRYRHQSFFSGHASSAFFSMAYTNIRIRSIMRHRLSAAEYRDWRWLPPTVFFSWAGYVGWSRIHAFKHYVSDVLAGSLVGWLLAELFHALGDEDPASDSQTAPTPMVFQVRMTF